MTLLTRLVLANALTLGAVMALLVLTPVTVIPEATLWEFVMLIGAVAVLWAANWALLHRALAPLGRLRSALDRLEEPGLHARVPADGDPEVRAIIAAYNDMLERLDAERAETTRQALAAQEDERARVSSDLHDEVGQRLTALLLRLRPIADAVPPEDRADLDALSDEVRSVLDEVRRISARLRPGVLRELGLGPALQSLVREMTAGDGPRAELSLTVEDADPDARLAALGADGALVVYRVAQEALTNVVRHAGATRVQVSLRAGPRGTVLRIADDGRGTVGRPGTGITGMRERARLVRGRLTVEAVPGRGTTVVLELPPGLDERAKETP